jgi:nucleoside-diphosphate-sugar epimerase
MYYFNKYFAVDRKKVIIGSGVIGSAFIDFYEKDQEICLYAAGVSNSQCIENANYLRDKNTLVENMSKLKKNELLVYISTCSILTSSNRSSSRYIEHKMEMEELVRSYGRYLIMRLPQIASFSKNPFTLLNYFKNKINNSEAFQVYKNSYRNILDVNHMASISEKVISNFSENSIVNIANPISVSVVEIVEEMEAALGKKAIYNFIDGLTDNYKIDVTRMMNCIDHSSYIFDDKYLNSVIKKYYK